MVALLEKQNVGGVSLLIWGDILSDKNIPLPIYFFFSCANKTHEDYYSENTA